jgi:hypothetical protein
MNAVLTMNMRKNDNKKTFGLKLLHLGNNELIAGCSDGSVKVLET